MRRFWLPIFGILPLILAGCGEGYSPNTYASAAAQEEAAVQRGVIIGVRQVMIAADGTIGAATGGAVGGVAGSQVPGAPVATALGAIGGTLAGGIGGNVAAHAVGDAKGWEYIVQEVPDGKLVSVTQTSKVALAVGTHVLVIAGAQQARIVPDYTVEIAAAAPKPVSAPVVEAPEGPVEINVDPVLPDGGGVQAGPVTVGGGAVSSGVSDVGSGGAAVGAGPLVAGAEAGAAAAGTPAAGVAR